MLICGSFFILAETPFQIVPHALELQTTTTAKKGSKSLSSLAVTQVSHIALELLDSPV